MKLEHQKRENRYSKIEYYKQKWNGDISPKGAYTKQLCLV